MHGEKASGAQFYLPSLVLAICIVAAVLAACGGGGEDEGSTTSVASNNGSQEASGESGAEGAGGGEALSGGRNGSQNSAGTGAGSESGDGGEPFGGEGNEAGSSQGGGNLGAQKAKDGAKTRSTRSNGSQGDSSSGDGGTKGLITQADSVCRRWGKKIEADALKDYSGDLNGSKGEQREGIESLAESVEKYLLVDLEAERREVGALMPSSADEREAQAVALASIGELIDVGKSDPEGLILGTSQTKEAEEKVKAYGFNACGNLTGRLVT